MNDRVRHAKAYPFPILDRSFIYEDHKIKSFRFDEKLFEHRTPVLAAGSNQSHEQLIRKFSVLDGDVTIPCVRGKLHDFDVVYAAHITGYGSIPATFQASPGTQVQVFVSWFDERQLDRMHATEGNYTFDRLSPIRIVLDHGQKLIEAYAYSSKVGCLNREGEPVALAEIPAENRTFPAIAQPDILAHVRDRLSPDHELDDFIFGHLEDRELHRARSSELKTDALPLDFDRQVIETL